MLALAINKEISNDNHLSGLRKWVEPQYLWATRSRGAHFTSIALQRQEQVFQTEFQIEIVFVCRQSLNVYLWLTCSKVTFVHFASQVTAVVVVVWVLTMSSPFVLECPAHPDRQRKDNCDPELWENIELLRHISWFRSVKAFHRNYKHYWLVANKLSS